QAALLVSQGRHAEADDLVRDLVLTESTLEGAAVFRSLGEWHALAARWRLAAERFETLLQIHHLESADVSSLDYLEYGPTLIESGQEEAYEAFRRDAIARHVGKQTPFADRIVKISLLRPADPATLASLDPLVRVSAELALQAKAQRDHFVYSWSAMSLALYAYRADDLERAVQWAESSLALGRENGPRVATLRTILAMTRYRLDDHSTARRELLAARSLIDEHDRHPLVRGSPVNGFWFDWALARILQREASALVEMPRAGEEPGATR
ncbi:MAG: serine/threonine protein kinase, partial [Opitutales bacterium]